MSCGFAKQKQEHELMYDNNGPSDDKEQDWEKNHVRSCIVAFLLC